MNVSGERLWGCEEDEVMGRYIKALAAAIGLSLAVPATALAGPAVAVSIGVPRPAIVAPEAVFTLRLPGPDYVWVEGGYRYDEYGRLVWVPAHWRLKTLSPVYVGRPYVAPRHVVVAPRPVVVAPRPVVVIDRDRHDHHGNVHHDHRGRR
jgi:hypothetical protein